MILLSNSISYVLVTTNYLRVHSYNSNVNNSLHAEAVLLLAGITHSNIVTYSSNYMLYLQQCLLIAAITHSSNITNYKSIYLRMSSMLLTTAIAAAMLLTEVITFSSNVAREAITFSSNAWLQFPYVHASLNMA